MNNKFENELNVKIDELKRAYARDELKNALAQFALDDESEGYVDNWASDEHWTKAMRSIYDAMHSLWTTSKCQLSGIEIMFEFIEPRIQARSSSPKDQA